MNGAAERLSRWLADNVGLEGAVLERRLGGGNANVTELVRHDSGKVVLRRPPDAAISASAANGVRREYHMLRALAGRARVPTPLGFCDDQTIIGQPFIVVEHVEGVAISTELPPAYDRHASTVNRIGEELVDAIGAVHALDWRELGLQPPSGDGSYVRRQIERWMRTRETDAVRDLPLLATVGRWLLARCPPSPALAVMHGDYHLDNTLFRRDEPRLAAIIDWELATVGDPCADLGLLLAFWGDRPVAAIGFPFVQQATRGIPGVVSRNVLADRWSRTSGIAIADLDFYMAFALWRLAAIVEGAYALHRRGLVADQYSRNLEHDVPNLLAEAARIAGVD